MTDVYDSLYALLDADDWSNYGTQPTMLDSWINNTDVMGEDFIIILPDPIDYAMTGNNTISHQRLRATIIIVATTKANRDKILQDVKDCLEGSVFWFIGEGSPDNYADRYERSVEVETIA